MRNILEGALLRQALAGLMPRKELSVSSVCENLKYLSKVMTQIHMNFEFHRNFYFPVHMSSTKSFKRLVCISRRDVVQNKEVPK